MSEHTKGEITITTPFSLIDNEIFEAKGRLVAKCWRKDVSEILLNILNSQPDLLERLEKTTKYLEIRTKKQSKYSIPRLVDKIIEANKVVLAKAKKVRE